MCSDCAPVNVLRYLFTLRAWGALRSLRYLVHVGGTDLYMDLGVFTPQMLKFATRGGQLSQTPTGQSQTHTRKSQAKPGKARLQPGSNQAPARLQPDFSQGALRGPGQAPAKKARKNPGKSQAPATLKMMVPGRQPGEARTRPRGRVSRQPGRDQK